MMSAINFFIKLKRFFFCTVILDNQDFIICVFCLFPDRLQTFFQCLQLILVRNQDRHHRTANHRILHPIVSKIAGFFYFCLNPQSLKMGFYCSPACMKCINLTFRII